MSEANPTRVRAWIRAVPVNVWVSDAGSWFREVLAKLGRFGGETLRLQDRVSTLHEALWQRATVSAAGRENADALLKWQEAENKRILAKVNSETVADKIEQERIVTQKLNAETEKVRAETRKVLSEADKLQAEAFSMRIDAAIRLADRLSKARVWIVPEKDGSFRLLPLPKDADVAQFYPELIPGELIAIDPAEEKECEPPSTPKQT